MHGPCGAEVELQQQPKAHDHMKDCCLCSTHYHGALYCQWGNLAHAAAVRTEAELREVFVRIVIAALAAWAEAKSSAVVEAQAADVKAVVAVLRVETGCYHRLRRFH